MSRLFLVNLLEKAGHQVVLARKAAETAESLSVELEGKTLKILYQNVGDEIEIFYYKKYKKIQKIHAW